MDDLSLSLSLSLENDLLNEISHTRSLTPSHSLLSLSLLSLYSLYSLSNLSLPILEKLNENGKVIFNLGDYSLCVYVCVPVIIILSLYSLPLSPFISLSFIYIYIYIYIYESRKAWEKCN